MANLKNTKVNGTFWVVNGNGWAKNTTTDLKLADNGVESTVYPSTCGFQDKNGLTGMRIEARISPTGSMSSYWYVQNFDSAGTSLGLKGIELIMDKSGTLTYKIADNANFRSALSLGNAATRTVKTASAATDTGWSTTAERTKVPDMSFMSYWNGAYSGTNSNLAYCNKGAFGNVCTLEYEQVDSW